MTNNNDKDPARDAFEAWLADKFPVLMERAEDGDKGAEIDVRLLYTGYQAATARHAELLREVRDTLGAIQIYSVPEPGISLPVLVANDLIIIDKMCSKALAKINELLGDSDGK